MSPMCSNTLDLLGEERIFILCLNWNLLEVLFNGEKKYLLESYVFLLMKETTQYILNGRLISNKLGKYVLGLWAKSVYFNKYI